MSHFQYWKEGLLFIGAMLFIVSVPCIAVGVLGTRLINHIGQFPSKSAGMQIKICLQLLLVELFSFALLALFFQVFS